MKLYFIVIFLYIGYTLATNSTLKDYYDLDDKQDLVIVWKTLFTKLNILLVETAEIKQNFRDLEKRQEEQEKQISNLMKSVNANGNDLNKSLLPMNIRIDDLTKRQHTQENLVQKSCKQIQEWTTILRRQDGSVDFYRNWTEYKIGFGHPPNGEFFIGLERLHVLTKATPHELLVVVKDWNDEMRYAMYDHFKIGSEKEKYALKVLGNYTGDAGDSLDFHRGMLFSTFDQDNDEFKDLECAKYRTGAWWYKNCYNSHLTGPYRKEEYSKQKGVGWNAWYGQDYSFKFAEMKIRSKSL